MASRPSDSAVSTVAKFKIPHAYAFMTGDRRRRYPRTHFRGNSTKLLWLPMDTRS